MSQSTAARLLDADSLSKALQRGICDVVLDQETLNRINVFPVADGDTGTNLALTLTAVQPCLQPVGVRGVGSLLGAVADAMLDGARGNSGAILAQFFQGLSDAAAGSSRFTVESFAAAVRVGAVYAREALTEPCEGTILSVIDAFAESLGLQAEGGNGDFAQVLDRGLTAARQALARTQHQLAALSRAAVVDAGARGFVVLIEGMLAFIRDGETVDPVAGIPGIPLTEFVRTAGEDGDLEYRYCTECVVSGTTIDRRRLRERLAEFGSSLVLAGTHNRARIHIHVNEPDRVFLLAAEYGSVSSEKADDMHRQQHSTHGSRRITAIVTDSGADIPDIELEKLNIHLVPLRLNFGDRGYMDKLTISAREFFRQLETSPVHPQTSQPAPGDFRRQYQFLATHFPDVVAISLTGKVSGTLNAAETAANRVSAPGRIHVIDSLNASVGQGLLVIEAAEHAAAGLEATEIIARLRASIGRTRSFALLNDLRYAVRGGRVPKYRKLLADCLRINPVLSTTPDGRVASDGMLLGRGRRLPKFSRYILRRSDKTKTYRLAVGHANCAGDARMLAELLCRQLSIEGAPYFSEIGAAIGVHGGPGTLVAALQERR